MKWIKHDSLRLVPLLAIGVDPQIVIDRVWEYEECDIPAQELIIEEEILCKLDPGGMYMTTIPHTQFELWGNNFDIQWSMIGDVLFVLEFANTEVPGLAWFRMWRNNYIMPVELFQDLKVMLKTLEKTDEALNAELTFKSTLSKLEDEGHIITATPAGRKSK